MMVHHNAEGGTMNRLRALIAINIALLVGAVACTAAPAGSGQPTATPPLATAEPAQPTTTSQPETSGSRGRLILATTTSTEDSGLLDAILPDFERRYNADVQVIAVGTGEALTLGENGDADVVLVHARAREDAFVEAGYGVNRQDVMYNDFVI